MTTFTAPWTMTMVMRRGTTSATSRTDGQMGRVVRRIVSWTGPMSSVVSSARLRAAVLAITMAMADDTSMVMIVATACCGDSAAMAAVTMTTSTMFAVALLLCFANVDTTTVATTTSHLVLPFAYAWRADALDSPVSYKARRRRRRAGQLQKAYGVAQPPSSSS